MLSCCMHDKNYIASVNESYTSKIVFYEFRLSLKENNELLLIYPAKIYEFEL